MKRYKYASVIIAFTTALLTTSSCKNALDINNSPNNFSDVPVVDLYNAAAVNVGFTGGSDLSRYTALIMQQWSGQSTGSLNQTQQYETYLIQGSDLNNLWNSFYTNTLVNLNIIIQKASATSPHFSGAAKLLTAYTYGIMVDTWGKIPYSQALQLTVNTAPVYDDDASIYASLLAMIDSGIADLNAATGAVELPTASPIFPGAYATVAKAKWIKFASTLKLRLLLHMMKYDQAGTTTKINALIGSGATFMAANADDFNATFYANAGAQNPIYQFETGTRNGYMVANNFLVTLMGTKQDPRMPLYFTPATLPYPTPVTTTPPSGIFLPQTYAGVVYEGSVAGAAPNEKFSHVGAQSSTNSVNYYLTGIKGEAPIHMLNYSEYLFVRAELNLVYSVALPVGFTLEQLYQEGIKQSCLDAGVDAPTAAAYSFSRKLPATNSTLQSLQSIIEEKYVASYGEVVEPWTDYRRTGFPLIALPTTPVFQVGFVPRSFYYPQSEINTNLSCPGQKADLLQRVFWDK